MQALGLLAVQQAEAVEGDHGRLPTDPEVEHEIAERSPLTAAEIRLPYVLGLSRGGQEMPCEVLGSAFDVDLALLGRAVVDEHHRRVLIQNVAQLVSQGVALATPAVVDSDHDGGVP